MLGGGCWAHLMAQVLVMYCDQGPTLQQVHQLPRLPGERYYTDAYRTSLHNLLRYVAQGIGGLGLYIRD